MIIDKRDIENLQVLKIKHSLDEFPDPSNYLYINGSKCIFVKRNKNKTFNIYASPACKLSFIDSQSYFNVICICSDLNAAVHRFNDYVKQIITGRFDDVVY